MTQNKIQIGARVQVVTLPIGFKERQLKGRTGIITSEKEVRGIYFYTVLIDRKPGERKTHTVDNITALKLKAL